MQYRLQASLATLGLICVAIAVLALAGAVAPAGGVLMAPGCAMFVIGLAWRPQRPQRPVGPGWYWNRAMNDWCRKPEPQIEDEFDAAIAAWRTVYGEDIGYNEHSATLAKLGAWHTANVLSSDQLADACESVEWITWALKQPEQKPPVATCSQTVREGQKRALSCGCSETERNPNCRHVRAEAKRGGGNGTLEQFVKGFADTLSLSEARPAVAAEYRDQIDHYTAMINADKRVSAETFEKIRAEFREQHAAKRSLVLEPHVVPIKSCKPGCASFVTADAAGNMTENFYCDGSHTLSSADGVVSVRQTT